MIISMGKGKPEQSKTITLGADTPSTVTPDAGWVLSSVPVSIDSSVIKAENIKAGAHILGIYGTHAGRKVEETKTVTLGSHEITSIEPYDGKVMSVVYIELDESIINSENIKSGVKILGVIGTHSDQKPEQTKTVTIGASAPSEVTPDSGKVLTAVYINLDTSLIKASNIKNGVTILGVTGTYSDRKTEQSKTLTLGSSAPSTVYPDSGKVLYQVPVSINSSIITEANIKAGVTMLGKNGSFTADANATAAQLLSGRTAYVNGSKITGTITTYDGSVT